MEDLHQIVYASKATHPMLPKDLAEILITARSRNLANGITGILLFRRGHFLQVLEGPREQLNVLLDKLSRDPRHGSVRVLLDEDVSTRAFGAWSMAFQDVTGLEPAALPGYSRFLKNGFGSVECVRYPHKVLRMALAFRDADLAQLNP
jgi:Sensors of blue-light using FAD